MRSAVAGLLLLACAACGSDSMTHADAAPLGSDASASFDAVAPDASAPAADASQADASTLGRLCATTAPDGGPGSCPEGVCCTAGSSTICTLASDCPAGPGYKSCSSGGDCQGSICCRLPAMTFCTKTSACSAYGGEIVP